MALPYQSLEKAYINTTPQAEIMTMAIVMNSKNSIPIVWPMNLYKLDMDTAETTTTHHSVNLEEATLFPIQDQVSCFSTMKKWLLKSIFKTLKHTQPYRWSPWVYPSSHLSESSGS